MEPIINYSDVIYHFTAFFELSLKMSSIIVMLYVISLHFWAEFEKLIYLSKIVMPHIIQYTISSLGIFPIGQIHPTVLFILYCIFLHKESSY